MADYPVAYTDTTGVVRLIGTLAFTDPSLVPGARWFDGGGPPSNSYGDDGDYYLDDDTGNVYRKEGGTWA